MNLISVVYHSEKGHTATIAKSICTGITENGGEAVLMDCKNPDWDILEKSAAIVFGCPTYMGSTSATFKAFMDASSNAWKGFKWKNKIAAGFTNSAALSGDKLNTLIQISIFAFQHGMVWVGLDLPAGVVSSKSTSSNMNRIGSWIGLMTQSNIDEAADVSPPTSDHETAKYFGKRIFELTSKFNYRS